MWLGGACARCKRLTLTQTMKLQTIVCYSVAAAALAGTGDAQTRIDLRTQGKSVDFSGAASTLPSQTGTQLPAACQVGASFVLTTAAAGQNWYLCTSANQWTVQGTTLPAVSGNANTILSTDGASLIWKTLGGDISGPPTSVTVTGLLGRRLNHRALRPLGQFLVWDGAQWSPQTVTNIAPPVTSVFGRTGAVTAQTGDYTFAQIGGSVAIGQLPQTGGDLSGAITCGDGDQDSKPGDCSNGPGERSGSDLERNSVDSSKPGWRRPERIRQNAAR